MFISLQPFPGLAVYVATKYFVEGLTQSLRLEVVGTGVKLTSIQPGTLKNGVLGVFSFKLQRNVL